MTFNLLSAIKRIDIVDLLLVPETGALSTYNDTVNIKEVVVVKRRLPNLLSRFIEVLAKNRKILPEDKLLVLGDIPLKHTGRQVVLFNNPNLTKRTMSINDWLKFGDNFKFFVMRILLINHAKYVTCFMVQSEYVKMELLQTLRNYRGSVLVLNPTLPKWLLELPNPSGRNPFKVSQGTLGLFYPASPYDHGQAVFVRTSRG